MQEDLIAPADRRALKVLFDTYWTKGGWRNARSTTPQDFEWVAKIGWH
jgi:hypothetical protein